MNNNNSGSGAGTDTGVDNYADANANPNVKIRILAVNPGSTSTKIALFDDDCELFREQIQHSADILSSFSGIQDQLDFRTDIVSKTLLQHGYPINTVDVFVGRGGGLLSVTGGVYEVTDTLLSHASQGMSGQHPAQTGSQIAHKLAALNGKRAFIVNPPDVDELCPPARVTGIKGVYRESHNHALNQKEIALRFCRSRGLDYDSINLIMCHIGGGVSVSAHEKGRMIDTNDILRGSGPMSPTRAGDMPYMDVVKLAYSGDYTQDELTEKLNQKGGLLDYFGTADIRDIIKMIDNGDGFASFIFDGMVYQIAKYVGAMAVALKGKAEAVILTGGISNNKYFTDKIGSYVDWIADVVVIPGEFELEALASGALRVMRGTEKAKTYAGVPVWSGYHPGE